MTRKELISKGYTLHHIALTRGYVSRKKNPDDCEAVEYNGRFGTGYTVDLPNMTSTNYAIREYWIREDNCNEKI